MMEDQFRLEGNRGEIVVREAPFQIQVPTILSDLTDDSPAKQRYRDSLLHIKQEIHSDYHQYQKVTLPRETEDKEVTFAQDLPTKEESLFHRNNNNNRDRNRDYNEGIYPPDQPISESTQYRTSSNGWTSHQGIHPIQSTIMLNHWN